MDIITELKSRLSIYDEAVKLGFNGKKKGSIIQGDCPKHSSTKHSCFTIYPSTQRFHCFHCGESGDVINLYMLFKQCDFKTALASLAKSAGLDIQVKGLPPEEQAKREKELKEKKLVEDMLTEAAYWYHRQLEDYPDIMNHLTGHYKFSEKIVEELQIGFAPVHQNHSGLADYLNDNDRFKGKLHLCGLFSFKNPGGPYYDFFRGRIIIPYWRYGKVVYMAARATHHTPEDQYETLIRRTWTCQKVNNTNQATLNSKS